MRLFRCFLLPFLSLVPLAAGAKAAAKWEQWDACSLVADRYFDGDSFQIRHRGEIHVVRLYFVDAPELDMGFAARVADQAAHFGVKAPEVLRGGALAKAFAAKFLGQPFRVITRRQHAPGASRAPRIYAIVERDGWRLDAALIQAGLARPTSEIAEFPDAMSGGRRFQQLRSLEQLAKNERRGLWAEPQRAARAGKAGASRVPKSLPDAWKVNLNTAAATELEALPGLGAGLARAIIQARPLRNIDELERVPGIGPKKIAALRGLVTFE